MNKKELNEWIRLRAYCKVADRKFKKAGVDTTFDFGQSHQGKKVVTFAEIKEGILIRTIYVSNVLEISDVLKREYDKLMQRYA